MAYRSIGQERVAFAASSGSETSLVDLPRLIDWDGIADIFWLVHAALRANLKLFRAITQFKPKLIAVKSGTLFNATIIETASRGEDDARWVKNTRKPAFHSLKAHVGADADTALIEEIAITCANINDGRAGRCPRILAKCLHTEPIRGTTYAIQLLPKAGLAYRHYRYVGGGGAREDNWHMKMKLWASHNVTVRQRQNCSRDRTHDHRLLPKTTTETIQTPG